MTSCITSTAKMANLADFMPKKPSIASKNLEPSPHRAAIVDTFERRPITRGSHVAPERVADTGKTDQYKALKGVLDTGVKAGDDMLVDQQVEALIRATDKPKTKAEQDARNAFLTAAANAGYDVSGAPNRTGR